MEPFLPFTSKKLCGFLNIDQNKWFETSTQELVSAGHVINEPEILFSKIDDEKIEEQLEKLKQPVETVHAPMKDEVTFDDFTKMDIRVGTILTAEKVKKADKLLMMTVDTGLDTRTVVSGIAQHYSPDEIIGQKVSILMNLAPRKIRGVESQGMILMAEDSEGNLCFVAPTKEMEAGGEIR